MKTKEKKGCFTMHTCTSCCVFTYIAFRPLQSPDISPIVAYLHPLGYLTRPHLREGARLVTGGCILRYSLRAIQDFSS